LKLMFAYGTRGLVFCHSLTAPRQMLLFWSTLWAG
jgi:hypothetical protein